MPRISVLALALALASPVLAQDEPAPWARPYAGTWTLEPSSEGGYACTLKLKSAMAIGGAQIELSSACRKNFPLEDVAGWSLSGKTDIVFIDALRKPVLRFKRGDDGSYMAEVKGHDSAVLTRGDRIPKQTAHAVMNGSWSLSGPDNQPTCGFAMTSAKAGTSGTLKRAGQCAARWKSQAWSKWSIKADQITLSDKAGKALLVLKRGDRTTFMKETKDSVVFFGPGEINGG